MFLLHFKRAAKLYTWISEEGDEEEKNMFLVSSQTASHIVGIYWNGEKYQRTWESIIDYSLVRFQEKETEKKK